MKKIFLTFIMLAFAHIIFAQNKQTVVVRPETNLEKTVREANDAVEAIGWLGEVFGEAMSNRLKKIKNSNYSVFVEKELENWKKKGGFETTADWQRRLTDSTEIKRSAIQESHINIYAKELGVSTSYDDYACELAGMPFYHSGVYDADNEVLIVNTFWGNIPIPIPLDEAKIMRWDMQRLENLKARFFIQNDQLALLSLIYSNNSKTYTWENPSQSAQIVRNKILELERLDSLELARYNQKLDSIFTNYNSQLLQNPYNLSQKVLENYNEVTGKDRREYNFNNSVSSMKSNFERLNNGFSREYENEYQKNGKLFPNEDEFDTFYKQGKGIYPQEIEKRTILNYFTANSQFIESMDFQKEKKATVGSAVLLVYTGINTNTNNSNVNADRKKILSVISESRNRPYYSQIMDFVIKTNKGLNKEWNKNGKFFESKSEFYNAYLSNDYKKILKSNKSKTYTYENPAEAAQILHKEEGELEQKKAMELAEKEREEQIPQFPGGGGELMKFLNGEIKYPVVAAKNGIQGRVVVSFVVEKDGKVSDVKVVKPLDPSLDKEAIRVISKMPKWIPGKQNGREVDVYYTLPITFGLQN